MLFFPRTPSPGISSSELQHSALPCQLPTFLAPLAQAGSDVPPRHSCNTRSLFPPRHFPHYFIIICLHTVLSHWLWTNCSELISVSQAHQIQRWLSQGMLKEWLSPTAPSMMPLAQQASPIQPSNTDWIDIGATMLKETTTTKGQVRKGDRDIFLFAFMELII